MRCLSILAVILGFGPMALSQELSPREQLFALKTRSSDLLHSVPNYTCVETLSIRRSSQERAQRGIADMIRVDIGVSDQKEIYGIPGAPRFSGLDLAALTGLSFATTGLYSALARGLMGDRTEGISLVGEEELDGEPMLRYDFNVPVQEQPWKIRYNGASAVAGERGSFWASRSALVLRRIAVNAVNITRNAALKELSVDVVYGSKGIAGRDVLLPSVAEVRATEKSRERIMSDAMFNHCRAFVAESTVLFSDRPRPVMDESGKRRRLPPGLEIPIALQNKIDAGLPYDSDLRALVTEPVFWKAKEIVSRGDLLTGTVQRSEWLSDFDLVLVTVEFDTIVTRSGPRDFNARLKSVPHVSGVQYEISATDRNNARARHAARRESSPEPQVHIPHFPGTATFYLKGRSGCLPAGSAMIWKTEEDDGP